MANRKKNRAATKRGAGAGKKRRPSQGRIKGRKRAADALILTVQNSARKSGATDVDFTFLREWLGPEISTRFLAAIQRYGRRYAAAQTTYSVRTVLKFWMRHGAANGWAPPGPRTHAKALLNELSEVRAEFYADEVKRGRALSTANNHWTAFLRLIDVLIQQKAIPQIEQAASAIAAPGMKLIQADREEAAQSAVLMSHAPRSLNTAMNSYNDNLLEPISIVDGSQTYLDAYEKRLGAAVNAILDCAILDFETFERKREIGILEIEQFDQSLLARFNSNSRRRFIDPTTGRNILGYDGTDPDLRTMLGIVHYEMGGIPKSRRKYDSKAGFASVANDTLSHWQSAP